MKHTLSKNQLSYSELGSHENLSRRWNQDHCYRFQTVGQRILAAVLIKLYVVIHNFHSIYSYMTIGFFFMSIKSVCMELATICSCSNSSRGGDVCLFVHLSVILSVCLPVSLAVWLCHCFSIMFLSFVIHKTSTRYSPHEVLVPPSIVLCQAIPAMPCPSFCAVLCHAMPPSSICFQNYISGLSCLLRHFFTL